MRRITSVTKSFDNFTRDLADVHKKDAAAAAFASASHWALPHQSAIKRCRSTVGHRLRNAETYRAV